MADWIDFLSCLARDLRLIGDRNELRVSAFLTLPILDYASVVVSGALIAEKYRDPSPLNSEISPHDFSAGDSIYLPVLLKKEGSELRRKLGVVEGVQETAKGIQLEARTFDFSDKVTTRYIPTYLLPLVERATETPDLESRTRGSLLVQNFQSLQDFLGETGTSQILRGPSKDCLIIDSKSRLQEESKTELRLRDTGKTGATKSIVLRDLLRLESEGPRAMVETYCSKVSSDAEIGWDATVVGGSLNFLREWENIDSRIRVALLSRSENAYGDALNFANSLYLRRQERDISISQETLALKPASIDVQLMFDR